ncbi:MAG: DUF5615 family PIN-like protein [Cyanobacteria bacterium J06643_4]
MSLRLLIDEDSQAKVLVKLLRVAGHDVVTINEMGIAGASDNKVLELACLHNRIVLTRNHKDFLALHKIAPTHPGILTIGKDEEPDKNMPYREIVKAIENVENLKIAMNGLLFSLNQFRY